MCPNQTLVLFALGFLLQSINRRGGREMFGREFLDGSQSRLEAGWSVVSEWLHASRQRSKRPVPVTDLLPWPAREHCQPCDYMGLLDAGN